MRPAPADVLRPPRIASASGLPVRAALDSVHGVATSTAGSRRSSRRSFAMPNPNRSTAVQRALTVLLAMAATLVVWAVEAYLLGIDLHARPVPGAAAVVVLLVSLAGPLGGAVTTRAAIGLATMHLVAAAILIPLLARTARRA